MTAVAIPPAVKAEADEARELIAKLERDLGPALRALEKAQAQEHRIEMAVVRRHSTLDSATAKEREQMGVARKATDKASHVYDSIHVRIRQEREKLDRINDPAEIARRTEQRARLDTLKKEKTMNKVTALSQGFPTEYLGDNGNFKPGLDARAKSDLVNAYLEQPPSKDALATFTKDEAAKLLKARGWMKFVEKRQAALTAAAARAEKKAAAKAEAKAKPKAEKPEAEVKDIAEARAAKAGGEVTPDPKPEPKPRGGRQLRRGSTAS